MLVRVSAFIAIVAAVVVLMSTWPSGASVAGPEPTVVAPVVRMAARATHVSPPVAITGSLPVVQAADVGMPRVWRSPRQEFERTADLFAFWQRIEPRAAAGDAQARWLVSRVHEYCDGYARAPVDYQRDTGLIESLALPAARPLADARSRIAARCRRFVPGDALSVAELVQQRQEAALGGSLAAEAALLAMGEPLDDDLEYRGDLVERVQASGDPEAYVALAPAMGLAAAGDAGLEDRIAGDLASELAWKLAGCRLGLDCAAEGALMTAYCANGGVCARRAQQDFSSFVRETAVSRHEADVVDDMVDALLRRHRLGMLKK